MIRYLRFQQAVPVIGTSLRVDEFDADSGWHIAEIPGGVRLSRPANPAQNVPAVPAFRVMGVGYGVPEAEHGPQGSVPRDGESRPAAVAADGPAPGADPGGAPEAPKQAEVAPQKAPRGPKKVKP